MRFLRYCFIFLLLCLCIQHFGSCKKLLKPDLIDEEDPYLLTYELSDFEGLVEPFQQQSAKMVSPRQKSAYGFPELQGPLLGDLLAYWHFNQQDTKANVKAIREAKLLLETIPRRQKFTYIPGFHHPDNPTDKSLEVFGANIIGITLSVHDLSKLLSLEFDIAVEKKGIHSIRVEHFQNGNYVTAQLADYKSLDKTVDELKPQRVSFDLSGIVLLGNTIQINVYLIAPVTEGQTDGFNLKKSQFDNVRVYGHFKSPFAKHRQNLHYYFFQKDSKKLFAEGQLSPQDMKVFSVRLPHGKYKSALVYVDAEKGVSVPKTIREAGDLVVGQEFDQYTGRVFGVVDSFDLQKPINRKISLERMYNQVTVEFIDKKDLTSIDKVEIRPINSFLSWTPLFQQGSVLISDETSKPIVFKNDFQSNRRVTFHHFVGKPEKDRLMQYRMTVYEKEKFMRMVDMQVMAKNNSKITFKGYMIPTGMDVGGFEAILDEKWGESKTGQF